MGVCGMTREAIFREITTERQCQDAIHGGPEHDDTLDPNDWIAIMARQLGLACNDGGKLQAERYRKQLVRLAATAIAAVEAQDRQTGREVVSGKHQPGSGF